MRPLLRGRSANYLRNAVTKTVMGLTRTRSYIGLGPSGIFISRNYLEIKFKGVIRTLECVVRVRPRHDVKGLDHFVQYEPRTAIILCCTLAGI